jgi:hypothetical protein
MSDCTNILILNIKITKKDCMQCLAFLQNILKTNLKSGCQRHVGPLWSLIMNDSDLIKDDDSELIQFVREIIKKPVKKQKEHKTFYQKSKPSKPLIKPILVQCSMSLYCYQSCTHHKPHFPVAMLRDDRVCTKHIFCEVVNKACHCQPIKKKEINHAKVKKDQSKQKDCQEIKKHDQRTLL